MFTISARRFPANFTFLISVQIAGSSRKRVLFAGFRWSAPVTAAALRVDGAP
jgi:hypothetical protein